MGRYMVIAVLVIAPSCASLGWSSVADAMTMPVGEANPIVVTTPGGEKMEMPVRYVGDKWAEAISTTVGVVGGPIPAFGVLVLLRLALSALVTLKKKKPE